MAGYMTKMYGNLYEGEFRNGAAAPVANGTLMVLDTSTMKLVLPAADSTTKLICKEVTTIYDGIVAYRMIVDKLNKNYYFVENAQEYNDATEYDLAEYTVPVNGLLRAHPLQVNDEFLVTSEDTLTAGTSYGVKATGLIG
jgi:hypothetical protein